MSTDSIFPYPMMGDSPCETPFFSPGVPSIATVAYPNATITSSPTSTVNPSSNCEAVWEACYWHQMVEFDYILSTTYTYTVATVDVEIHKYYNTTYARTSTVRNDQDPDNPENQAYEQALSSAVPVPNRTGRTWGALEQAVPIGVGISHPYAATGSVAMTLASVDVIASRSCADGTVQSTTCALSVPRLSSSYNWYTVPASDWNLEASARDIDFISYSVINSLISNSLPLLRTCTGWAYGYPEALLPVLSLTVTRSNVFNYLPPPSQTGAGSQAASVTPQPLNSAPGANPSAGSRPSVPQPTGASGGSASAQPQYQHPDSGPADSSSGSQVGGNTGSTDNSGYRGSGNSNGNSGSSGNGGLIDNTGSGGNGSPVGSFAAPSIAPVPLNGNSAVVSVGGSVYTYKQGDKTLVIGGTTVMTSGRTTVVGGTTITAGDSAATVGGQVISLGGSSLYTGVPTATTGVKTSVSQAGSKTKSILSSATAGKSPKTQSGAGSRRMSAVYICIALLFSTIFVT